MKNVKVDSSLTLNEIITSNNNYKSKNWNKEKAKRYIFEAKDVILESSYFEHYNHEKLIKFVIELPISYGCRIGCRHCASGVFRNITAANEKIILDMALYMLSDNNQNKSSSFLVTFSGIGEGAFHKQTLSNVSETLYKSFPNSHYTFATSGLDATFIGFCEKLSYIIPFHWLQITYLHHNNDFLKYIIPNCDNLGFSFSKTLNKIKITKNIQIRINYVMIKNFNDNQTHWEDFIRKTNTVKDLITVRVSMMNETETSKINKLSPSSLSNLFKLTDLLTMNGYNAYSFYSAFNDNMNCGQLAWKYRNISRL